MKKNNRKGFTIVELVIVIAVIAILAGVLIPTFASITTKAKDSAALQEATNAYKEAYAEAISDGKIDNTDVITIKNAEGNIEWTFTFTDDKTASVTPPTDFGYTVAVTNGTVGVTRIK